MTLPDRFPTHPGRTPRARSGCDTTTRWGSLLLIVASLLLAGCLHGDGQDENDEPEPPTPQGVTLADFAECKGNYRGSDIPIRCENEIATLDPNPAFLLDGWDCVAEAPQDADSFGIRLYANATDGARALHHWVPHNVTVAGIVGIARADGTEIEYMNWNGADTSATSLLPALEQGTEVHVLLFTVPFRAEPPTLNTGSMRVDWSLHEGAPYPIRTFSYEGRDHYFPQNQPAPPDKVFPYQWGHVTNQYGADMTAEGEDFRILIQHFEYVRATLSVPSAGDPSC